jgi:hypothetical protein
MPKTTERKKYENAVKSQDKCRSKYVRNIKEEKISLYKPESTFFQKAFL